MRLWGWRNNISKKDGLMKHHMIRDVDTTSGHIETTIPMMWNIIPKKKKQRIDRGVNLCIAVKLKKGWQTQPKACETGTLKKSFKGTPILEQWCVN